MYSNGNSIIVLLTLSSRHEEEHIWDEGMIKEVCQVEWNGRDLWNVWDKGCLLAYGEQQEQWAKDWKQKCWKQREIGNVLSRQCGVFGSFWTEQWHDEWSMNRKDERKDKKWMLLIIHSGSFTRGQPSPAAGSAAAKTPGCPLSTELSPALTIHITGEVKRPSTINPYKDCLKWEIWKPAPST